MTEKLIIEFSENQRIELESNPKSSALNIAVVKGGSGENKRLTKAEKLKLIKFLIKNFEV